MQPRLKEYYTQIEKQCRTGAGQAGRDFAAGRAAGPVVASAAGRAGDLELLVRADAVVKSVARRRPGRLPAIVAQLVRPAQDLAASADAPSAARQTLEARVQPFEAMAKFPMPEGDLAKAAAALAGRPYAAAQGILNQAAGAGSDALAGGDPLPLQQALAAQPMFGLLKRRAAATTYRLEGAGTANLVTFSVPDKVWSQFVTNLDQKLQGAFALYAGGTTAHGPWLAAPAGWDAVYQPVAAGQRLTLDARTEGESDIDLLLRNLDAVAVPAPLGPAWSAWCVGYHATEAAVAMNAGLDSTAAWHRSRFSGYEGALKTTDLEPSRKNARPRG
jgi:hypothetical protein